MGFVVAEPCINCKYTDCVAVCPVDCFYEGANFLVIHPDECIDCGAVRAGMPDKGHLPRGRPAGEVEGVHGDQRRVLHQVAEHQQAEGSMPDAEKYKEMEGKRAMLKLEPPPA